MRPIGTSFRIPGLSMRLPAAKSAVTQMIRSADVEPITLQHVRHLARELRQCEFDLRSEMSRVLRLPSARRALFHAWPSERPATKRLIQCGSQHMGAREVDGFLRFATEEEPEFLEGRFRAGFPYHQKSSFTLATLGAFRADLDSALFRLVFTSYFSGPAQPATHPLITDPERRSEPYSTVINPIVPLIASVGWMDAETPPPELVSLALQLRHLENVGKAWVEGLEQIVAFS